MSLSIILWSIILNPISGLRTDYVKLKCDLDNAPFYTLTEYEVNAIVNSTFISIINRECDEVKTDIDNVIEHYTMDTSEGNRFRCNKYNSTNATDIGHIRRLNKWYIVKRPFVTLLADIKDLVGTMLLGQNKTYPLAFGGHTALTSQVLIENCIEVEVKNTDFEELTEIYVSSSDLFHCGLTKASLNTLELIGRLGHTLTDTSGTVVDRNGRVYFRGRDLNTVLRIFRNGTERQIIYETIILPTPSFGETTVTETSLSIVTETYTMYNGSYHTESNETTHSDLVEPTPMLSLDWLANAKSVTVTREVKPDTVTIIDRRYITVTQERNTYSSVNFDKFKRVKENSLNEPKNLRRKARGFILSDLFHEVADKIGETVNRKMTPIGPFPLPGPIERPTNIERVTESTTTKAITIQTTELTSLTFSTTTATTPATPKFVVTMDPIQIPMKIPKTTSAPTKSMTNMSDEEVVKVYEENYSSNRFNDLKFLAKCAAHGIQFSKVGTLHAFSDEFIHFIKLDFPFQDYELPRFSNIDTCYRFVDQLPTSSNSSADLRETLNQTCSAFEESMNSFVKETELIAMKSLEEFKSRQLTRNKRQDPFTIGAVIAVVGAVGWGIWATTEILDAKHDRKLLHTAVSQLEKDVETLAVNYKIMGDSLIGFSKELSSTLEQYDKKIEILRNFSIQRSSDIDKSLRDLMTFLDDKTTVVAIMSTFGDYRLSEVNAIQNQIIVLLDGIQTYENIFGVLRTGRLSHALISWSKLEKILRRIDEKLQRKFTFAISEAEKHLYYTFPLIAFDIKSSSNEIYISLRIPLVRLGRPRKYSIIKPQFFPFSCISSQCFNYGGTEKIISFEPSNRLWLVNEVSGEIMHEIDADAITCQYVNHKDECFTFKTNQMTEPTECNKGIYAWDQIQMIKYCEFIPAPKGEYQPIALGGDRYVIHKNVIPYYDLYCDEQRPKRIYVENWTELIELNRGCDIGLTDFGRLLYGPFSEPLRSTEVIEPSTFHSILLLLLQNLSSSTNLEFEDLKLPKIENPYITPFNPDEHALTVDWDTSTLTRFSNYLYKWNSNISTAVKNVEALIGRRSGSYSMKGLISTIGGIIQLLMTVIIVFGTLAYSRVIGHTGCLIVVMPRKVSAIFDLREEIMSTDWQTLTDLIVMTFLIITIMIIIKLIWCRKTFITTHIGKRNAVTEDNKGWIIVLNMFYNRIGFCRIVKETIHLRIPVTVMKANAVRDLRLVDAATTWFIKEVNGQKVIRTTDDVHLFALDSNGDRGVDDWEIVRIKVDDIVWRYEPIPTAFDRVNNHGLAIFSLARDKSAIL